MWWTSNIFSKLQELWLPSCSFIFTYLHLHNHHQAPSHLRQPLQLFIFKLSFIHLNLIKPPTLPQSHRCVSLSYGHFFLTPMCFCKLWCKIEGSMYQKTSPSHTLSAIHRDSPLPYDGATEEIVPWTVVLALLKT